MVLRVKLRYADAATFIEKFSVNVGRVGMFLPTRALQPVGTELRFELRLLDDQIVLAGMGRVASVHEPEPAEPLAAHGMAIEFLRMTRESRDLVMRMLDHRRAYGLGEPALPMPGHDHAAPPNAAPAVSPTKAAPADSTLEARSPEVAGAAAAAPLPAEGRSAAPALAPSAPAAPAAPTVTPAATASRAASSSNDTPAAPRALTLPVPLAAEPARPRRPRASELVASLGAAAPVPATGDELNATALDLERARARARAIARGTSDADLTALLRHDEPSAVDLAAATAELARQLGAPAPLPRERGRAEVMQARGAGPTDGEASPTKPSSTSSPTDAGGRPTPTATSTDALESAAAPRPSPSAREISAATAGASRPSPLTAARADASPDALTAARADASPDALTDAAPDSLTPGAPPTTPAPVEEETGVRRRRVSRPPRLTRPGGVFARTRAPAPSPAPEFAQPPDSEPATTRPLAAAPALPLAPLTEPTTPVGAPGVELTRTPRAAERAPASARGRERAPAGFERVLAELEEHERSESGEMPAAPTPPVPAAQAAPTPPISFPPTAPTVDPLDQLALEDLGGADSLASPTEPPAAAWVSRPTPATDEEPADELDLGVLGEAGFEILAEEDLDEALEFDELADSDPEAAPHGAAGALADSLTTPSTTGTSAVTVPTWRRTTGFDPLDTRADTAHGLDLAPPTIPGRIPTREIDLESALEALDLDADLPNDGPTLPGKTSAAGKRTQTAEPARAVPGAATGTAADGSPHQTAPRTDEPDDAPFELELDDLS